MSGAGFLYRLELEHIAIAHGLAPDVVHAICLVESHGRRWAWNPEPKYRYFWDVKRNLPFRRLTDEEVQSEFPPVDFPTLVDDPDQEWWAQQASWGLMQVMGAVAREHGFQEPVLTQLLEAEFGLEFGCRAFKARLKWAKGDVRAALAAYNGGPAGNTPGDRLRNGGYADKVLRALANIQQRKAV
jgi:Transglycosylase SLT domain